MSGQDCVVRSEIEQSSELADAYLVYGDRYSLRGQPDDPKWATGKRKALS